MEKGTITRRDFFKAAGLAMSAGLLAACNPAVDLPPTLQSTITAVPLPTRTAEPIVVDCWWLLDNPDLTAPLKTGKEIRESPDFQKEWYNGGYARQIFPPWLAQHPGVTLKITGHEWAINLHDNLLRAIAAGQIPDATYDEPYVTEFARLGVYQALPDQLKKLFPDSTIGGAIVDGKAYALPGSSGTNALGINLEVLAKAGLPVDKFPTTWEELLADARKVSAANQSTYGKNAYFCYPPDPASGSYGVPMRVLPWFNQNGAALSDEDGNPTANSDKAVETWLWHNELMGTSTQSLFDIVALDEGTAGGLFNQGVISYVMGWSGNWTWVGELGTNAVAVELPLPPGSRPGNIAIGNTFYAACKGGKQPDLGLALVSEIYTQEDNQAWLPQNAGVWIPAIKSLLEQWQTYDRLEAYKTEAAKQMVRVTMKALLFGNVRPLPPWAKNNNIIWLEWNKSYQRIWEGRLDKPGIKAELDQLQTRIESLLV